MAGHEGLPMRNKRKDIDRVNDDFSDFSLSSPATKIRRLDLDLPPILEEEEAPVNEERAIVLFKPQQPPTPNLYVDRNLISGFNNRFHQIGGIAADDLYEEEDKTNKQQALVRWEPPQFPFLEPTGTVKDLPEPEVVELDGEDAIMGEAPMDVEEENSTSGNSTCVFLPQWQQQQLHCMIPQLPQTNSNPISWYR